MFSTWETFSRKRYEKGREDERKAQAKRIAELEKDSEEVRTQRRMLDLIESLVKDSIEYRKEIKVLAKRVAELEKVT